MSAFDLLDRGGAPRLAYRRQPGDAPAVVFLPGYASDMEGAKAEALAAWAAARRRAYLRFDYTGCGRSEGDFATATIGAWLADAAAMIDAAAPGPVVLIGSSMGGWLALLLAVARPAQVTGVLGIAAAPDFTRWGVVETLTVEERSALARTGRFERARDGGDPARYTRAMIDEAGRHLILDRPIAYTGPVRLLHGQMDAGVPPRIALDIAARLASADVQVTLVKDGEHRLSRPADLALMIATLEGLPAR